MNQAPCILKVRIRYRSWRGHRNVGHQIRLLIVLAEGGRGKQRECEAKHQQWLYGQNTGPHYSSSFTGLDRGTFGLAVGLAVGKLLPDSISWVQSLERCNPAALQANKTARIVVDEGRT